MKTEKIIMTIKKVLELSKNNPSEEEARAAALKAQELLAKYNISMAEVDSIDDKELDNIEEVQVQVTASKFKYQLAGIIARNFRCRHYYYGKMVVVFYGHSADANIAATTFEYLYNLARKLGKRERNRVRNSSGDGSGVYNSFIAGFIRGIEESLDKQCEALALVIPEDVNKGFDEVTSGFHKMKNSGIYATKLDSYNRGVVEGHSAIGSRQLEG